MSDDLFFTRQFILGPRMPGTPELAGWQARRLGLPDCELPFNYDGFYESASFLVRRKSRRLRARLRHKAGDVLAIARSAQ